MELFDFNHYKDYLKFHLNDRSGRGGRGARAKLARAIGCQTAYVAQVLGGEKAQFSLEQGEAINDFWGHSEAEGHYFLVLIQHERAGSPKLRQRFARELQSIRESRLLLKNRLGVKAVLQEQDQADYYSTWFCAAIHALVSIPGYQSAEKIAARLGISSAAAGRALDLLLRSGILVRDEEKIKIGEARLHLPSDSPLIPRHHTNWRLQALRVLQQNPAANLHYSSVISVAAEDVQRIREVLIKAIATLKPIIRDSREEKLQCLSFDFFEV